MKTKHKTMREFWAVEMSWPNKKVRRVLLTTHKPSPPPRDFTYEIETRKDARSEARRMNKLTNSKLHRAVRVRETIEVIS